MKQFFYTLAFFVLVSAAGFWGFYQAGSATAPTTKPSKQQRIEEVIEDERRRTQDPALGRPTPEALIGALRETRRLQRRYAEEYGRNDLAAARFREHGPNNIGGRTRVILIDENDPDRNRIFAGGVSGGLWYTEDAGADQPVWQKVNDYLDNICIGALAQDPDDPQIMYMGTGEVYAGIPGLALFKSYDGGYTWELLPATLNGNFQFTQALFVHPETGDIYAGADTGLWRSEDGGASWERVLLAFIDDIEYSDLVNTLYVSTNNQVFKSATGDSGDWTRLSGPGNGFMTSVSRVEIAITKTTPVQIYAVGNRGGDGTEVYQLVDAPGFNWSKRSAPLDLNGVNFTRGQGGYDLEIAVDPRNPQRIFLGGIDLYLSNNGGLGWQQISLWTGGPLQFVHADQHLVIFDEENPQIMYFGNDGGVFRTVNGSVDIYPINTEYNVTQFYAGAIHPEAGRNYLIGGTQDNGSLQIDGPGIQSGREVLGGDGFYCHIDEDEPNIQMVSLYFAAYSLSNDGGQSFGGGASFNGRFVSPSDYDSKNNILYSQTNEGDFYRWEINNGASQLVDVVGENLSLSTVKVDPTVDNRIYIGTFSGTIVRIDDAHTGASVDGVRLASLTGTIGSIDVDSSDSQHLLVTVSNYGVTSVYESMDGGENWIGHEGNLPNIPVRWGIFNPKDNNSAMIATELGVWVTKALAGEDTEWIPPMPNRGIPLVRTTMLRRRRSDRVIMASTYGRGLFTTDVFADPRARLDAPAISYEDAQILFRGDASTNATTYFWDFGDGATDTLENVRHSFDNFGTYSVQLTVNNTLTDQKDIKVLPDRPLPYTAESEAYGGNFDNHPEDYGVETLSGSSFERGSSPINGKGGTHSGQNAFVLGLEEEFYQPNTHTMLYLPNYDFSEETIYEFSFWGKYQIHQGFDGLRVEYSTDRGETWQLLGDQREGWYNFTNTNADQAVWPVGTPYFTGAAFEWTKYRLNVSFLAGKEDVAFRFVFKGDAFGNYIGVAIDDVEITKYDGLPETELIRFDGEYSSPEEITINWNTVPEFKCVRFELEQSLNGRDFERLESIPAAGGTSGELQTYATTFLAQRSLYFFRLKVVNEDPATDYSYEFYSNTIVLRRNTQGTEVYRIFPNPFTTRIELTFNNVLERPAPYVLYDAAGRMIQEGILPAETVYGSFDVRPDLPFGTYLLTVDIDGEDLQTFMLQGGAR